MVVIRESPHAKLSPDRNCAHWPPRSPLEALLSSPSGRQRWQDSRYRPQQRSPSPSPLRKSVGSLHALRGLGEVDNEDGDQDEDEETLQLQLQAIQAKLKLKKLQNAKKTVLDEPGSGSVSRQERGSGSRKTNISPNRPPKIPVEVPASPIRSARLPMEQLSPARQKLGLTSIPKAQNVSLKRARDGNQLKRSRSQPTLQPEAAQTKSYSERLTSNKLQAEERQAKEIRLGQMRSSSFNHTKLAETSSGAKAQTVSFGRFSRPAREQRSHPSFAASDRKEGGLSRSPSARTVRDRDPAAPKATSKINAGAYGQDSGTGHAVDDSDSGLDIENPDSEAGYDPFSKIHLSKRHIQHSVVAREMEGKEVYSLPRLLKEVKSPHYDPPDCESDYVVFGVLASKSNPLDHAQTHRSSDQVKGSFEAPRNKFMVIRLCDMEWEVDCFLFGTAFNQFWKLTPGTLVAILNPAIMPPKGNQNNGRFSLKLGSSEDSVMEIGVARDLGYCCAMKKDGQQCGEWIDKRKAEACEFHLSLQIDKSRKERMEINSMFRGVTEVERRRRSHTTNGYGGKNMNGKYHREYGQLYSVNTGPGRSAASLLDAEDTDALHNMTQEEASRKRMANAQRERDLARKLGEMGSGVGAEYLRATNGHTASKDTLSSTASSKKGNAADDTRYALFAKASAAELGLLGKKASDVRLSPAKDRKRHFGLGSMSIPGQKPKSSEPIGWGGARKAGLLQPKESRLASPERGQTKLSIDAQSGTNLASSQSQTSSMRSTSPVKKKARFRLEKGIREPGRESLPGTNPVVVGDDDDDDLDII